MFTLLPDDNDGDIGAFINVVAAESRVAQDEEKKKRQEEKAEAKKQKQGQQEENLRHDAVMRAKRPVLSNLLYNNHIVFTKDKLAEEGKDQGVGVKEKGKSGEDVFQDKVGATVYHQERGSYSRGYSNEGDNGYQGNQVGEGRYERNYGRDNLRQDNNGGYGSYSRDCEKDTLYLENNGGEQGFRGERSYRRGRLYQENNRGERRYIRGNLYQENNGGEQGFRGDGNHRRFYFYQYNNGRDEGYVAYRGGGRWRGRGRGRGFNENNGSEDLVSEESQHVVKDLNGSTERQKNGGLSSGDSLNGVQMSGNSEKKELDDTEQPLNGDREEAADSNVEEKKKKKNEVNDHSKEKSQQKEESPANTMTYQEYEKVLLEKKKALEAMGLSEKPRANLDKDSESMQPIGKRIEESTVKPKSSEDKLRKKDGVTNKKNGSRSINIDEFLKPEKGKKYFAGYGGRTGYQGESSDGPGDVHNGRMFSTQAPAPRIDDVVQFPALGRRSSKMT